jgi:hypothetical protein
MTRKIYTLIIIFSYYFSQNMKYLSKRKQLTDKVIFDNESIKFRPALSTKENEFENILMPIFNEEIEKIKNGTSKLLTSQ